MSSTTADRAGRGQRLSPRARRTLLTAHILVSVGLFGDVAGFRAVATLGGSAPDD